jgi:phosphopantothenoylcysteine decarboxylase/phosphopantothenate--cysteine ligase
LAGGDSGTGRLADPSLIVERVLEVLAGDDRRDLGGLRVVITAGGTREPIDPVRFITNRSSGKQGHALAEVARRRGADVVLVTTTKLEVAPGVAVDRVETAAQMEAAVLAQAVRADVVVMAAAVADFRSKVVAETKLHKADGLPELVLEPTSDILAELGRRRREEQQARQESSSTQILVGFAAETDAVTERATGKLRAKGVDLIVANDVSAPGVGFDHDTNAVTILGADGTVTEVPLARKHAIADAVFDRVVALLAAQ